MECDVPRSSLPVKRTFNHTIANMRNVQSIVDEVRKMWSTYSPVEAIHAAATSGLSLTGLPPSLLPDCYCCLYNLHRQSFDYADPGVTAVLGIDPGVFDLSTWYSMVHTDDLEGVKWKEQYVRDFLLGRVSPAHRSGYRISYVFRMISSDGKEKKILHLACALTDRDGEPSHLVCIHTDVSFLDIERYDRISFVGTSGAPSFYVQETFTDVQKPDDLPEISLREKEILIHLSRGLSSKQIASELNISMHTVDTHRRNLLRKTKTKNTLQLTALCVKNGIIL